jgi:hypothetical protein
MLKAFYTADHEISVKPVSVPQTSVVDSHINDK